jgi:phosphatidate cytidylyltransferase
MTQEIKKRIITSFFLITLLYLMYLYSFILIISLIIIGIIVWIEFYALMSKIFQAESFNNKLLLFFVKTVSLIYITSLVYVICIAEAQNANLKTQIFFAIIIAISSDIGGLVVGSLIKGKKLTKISPKKTISGSIGSFCFSLLCVPFFMDVFTDYNFSILILITLVVSLVTQVGDLFVSFIKRKANVKDTSDLLPGHGGLLDRVDGIIFAIPFLLFLFYFF